MILLISNITINFLTCKRYLKTPCNFLISASNGNLSIIAMNRFIFQSTPPRRRRPNLEKENSSDIIELTRKTNNSRENLKFISDATFDKLTISAKKKGAIIFRGTEEAEKHLDFMNAAASNLDNILFFRKDVCISEVLEETYHFEQNLAKMNNDKGEPLRSILNEIDAKEYLLKNAVKFKIPRKEIEITQKQLESYRKQLEEISGE